MELIGRRCKWGESEFGRYQKGSGLFLGFGVDYEELGEGVGHFSVAIVEREPDGQVLGVPIQSVQFINSKPKQSCAQHSPF